MQSVSIPSSIFRYYWHCGCHTKILVTSNGTTPWYLFLFLISAFAYFCRVLTTMSWMNDVIPPVWFLTAESEGSSKDHIFPKVTLIQLDKDKYIHIIQDPTQLYSKEQRIEISLVYNHPTFETSSTNEPQIKIWLQMDFEIARKAHRLAQSHCLLVDVAKDGA